MIDRNQFLEFVASYPLQARQLLRDKKVVRSLESLGVLLSMFELHAPGRTARSTKGLGPTLCGYRGRRHPTLVTCRKCLPRLQGA